MKTLITSIIILLTLSVSAQKTYVKITKGKEVIYYPPGTHFDLKNPHGYIILKYSETPRVEKIEADYKLVLYPNWREGEEIIELTKGDQVELALTKDWGKVKRDPKSIYIKERVVVSHKKLTDSEKFEGKKNLEFELSNGIKFVYKDKKYYATYRGKDINIKNKYIITTKVGTLKLSFNSSNGVVWWVFEKAKKTKS